MISIDESELYTLLHTGNPGDVEFYSRAFQGTKSLLELGCGWGRIAAPLAHLGCNVFGLDENEHFLKIARKNVPAAQFVHGDARTYSPQAVLNGERVDAVLLAYNTIYSLGGRDAVARCLQKARRSLVPEGELWLDVYPSDSFHEALLDGEMPPEDDGEAVATFKYQEHSVSVFEETEFLVDKQQLRVVYRALVEEGEVGRLEMTHDYLTSSQLLELLHQEGFAVQGVFGSFTGAPFDDDAEHFICGATLAPA